MSDIKIPTKETKVCHLDRMGELNQRMDQHIIDLDELNARLEENFRWRSH